MTTPLNAYGVQSMLTQDMTAATELKALLLNEREMLEQRQHQDLPQLIERKDQLLEALGISAKQRASVLQEYGLKATAEHWDQLLAQTPATAELRSGWQELKELFSECQSLNEINGKMINRSKQTLGKLLNLLRGNVAAPQLYTSTGTTTNSSSSFSVTEA